MTRSRIRLFGVVATVFGVLAISAGAAQASLFNWVVLNSSGIAVLDLKASLKGTVENEKMSLLTHLLGLSIEIRCAAGELVGLKLEAEGKLTNGGKVVFTGCESFDTAKGTLLANCRPKTTGTEFGTIETKATKGELVLHNGELLIKVEPKEGTGFITFVFEEGCSFGESVTLNGVLFLKDCKLELDKHLVTHLLEQGPLTELWVGAKNEEHLLTSIDGTAFVELSGEHLGLKWAGEHNP